MSKDGRETAHYPHVIDSWVLAQTKHELRPGQAVALQAHPIQFASKKNTSAMHPVIACQPGRYSLKYDVRIPDNTFPERGEWRGTVTTGLRPVEITAQPMKPRAQEGGAGTE